jgi:uncharacterized damage-inducible protein DinB
VSADAGAGGTSPNPLAGVDHHSALRDGRERLLRAFGSLDAGDVEQVVHGEWRVHDLLAHLAAWDELVAGFLRDVAAGERQFELTVASEDDWGAWNAAQVAAATGSSVDERLERLHAARDELLDAVSALGRDLFELEIAAPWGTIDSVRGHIVVQGVHDAQHADTMAGGGAGS